MYPNFYQNMLPPQQILQANGLESIKAMKMAPNSSALIADQSRPIVWKCISDSLGNVNAEAFDITPHKDEVEVEKETLNNTLNSLIAKLNDLEVKYESLINKHHEFQNVSTKATVQPSTENAKPTGLSTATHFSKPKV